ncbi:MFS transporter [uncultured Nevskia sp.]|uniref:MFS transporter n=1 Tax=uncultured Nevskia sp. TaxID=228950 RepID=UPI0025E7DD2C|nr:MFS transporter [uncultured Nevskia sp.]
MRHRSTSLLALTWLAFFMADVRDGLGPFLATYLQEHRVQQELIGYTMTAGGLAAVAMTPFAGAWVDSSSAKRAMTVVAALAVLAASAIAFTTLSASMLIASQIVTGVAGAVLAATMAALTLGLARSAGFKQQTGRNEAFSHAGNMISAVGAGLAAHLFGAPWMLAVMAALTVGALLSAWAIRAAEIDHEAARGDEPQDARPAEIDGQGHAPIVSLFRNRPLLFFALACAFFHLGNAAMLPLLNQRLAATVADSAPLLWTGIAIVVAQLTMIPVALWVARSRRYDVAWFVYAAILVLPLRGALAYAFASEWNNIPVQILDGLAAGALGVATPLLVQRYTRGSGRFNTALGFVMTLQGVGAALSPAMANAVVGAGQHFGLAFVVLAATSVLALPIFRLAQRGTASPACSAP